MIKLKNHCQFLLKTCEHRCLLQADLREVSKALDQRRSNCAIKSFVPIPVKVIFIRPTFGSFNPHKEDLKKRRKTLDIRVSCKLRRNHKFGSKRYIDPKVSITRSFDWRLINWKISARTRASLSFPSSLPEIDNKILILIRNMCCMHSLWMWTLQQKHSGLVYFSFSDRFNIKKSCSFSSSPRWLDADGVKM